MNASASRVIFEKSFKNALMQFERIAFSVKIKKNIKERKSKEEIYEMRNKKNINGQG